MEAELLSDALDDCRDWSAPGPECPECGALASPGDECQGCGYLVSEVDCEFSTGGDDCYRCHGSGADPEDMEDGEALSCIRCWGSGRERDAQHFDRARVQLDPEIDALCEDAAGWPERTMAAHLAERERVTGCSTADWYAGLAALQLLSTPASYKPVPGARGKLERSLYATGVR